MRMGMNRGSATLVGLALSLPHSCGVEPWEYYKELIFALGSPRMWGWTVITSGCCRIKVVFPTDVGLNRLLFHGQCVLTGLPHVYGVEPECLLESKADSLLSSLM